MTLMATIGSHTDSELQRDCQSGATHHLSRGDQSSQSSDGDEAYERYLERIRGGPYSHQQRNAEYFTDDESLDDFIVSDEASLSGESSADDRLFYIKTTNLLEERSTSVAESLSSQASDDSVEDVPHFNLSGDMTSISLEKTKEESSSIYLHNSVSNEGCLKIPAARAALISDSDESFDELIQEGVKNQREATSHRSDGSSDRNTSSSLAKSKQKDSLDLDVSSLVLTDSDDQVMIVSEPIKTSSRRPISTNSQTCRPFAPRGFGNNYTPPTNRTFSEKKQPVFQAKTEPRLRTTESSFLSSLSTHLDKNQRRHHAAEKYVREFKKYKDELVKRLNAFYNQNIYGNKLNDVTITFNKLLLKTAGLCKYMKTSASHARQASIELSEKVCDTAERVRDTLIHEMCHAAVWIVDGVEDGHGRYWQFWSRKAELACKELPPIRRCHSYDITTKFVYECTRCKYQIGRHSKSLDTETKVCGRCRGKFQLLTRTSKGQMTPVSSTPNRFALFIKDNYGPIRKETSSHQQTMQQLSENFTRRLNF
ncbi:germ cell nuclear acidic protein-like [Watersipora subatra]|uniref:germ cell nuclear acidic protein-like n=1 Tax=Watersipora subatra TaxID=2589382 RepID=UPI00355BEFD9